MPRTRRFVLLCVALALTSCSKSSPTAPNGGTSDSRGTPLTGEMAFETSTRLTWSQATNEVLGSAKAGGTLGGPGLVAVRVIDGAVRLLDPSPALFPLVTPDGQQVYYDAVTVDSTVLRRRSLGATTTTRIAAVAGLGAYTFALSPDGLYLAYSGPGADPLEPDSVRVLNTASGQRVTYGPAAPVTFSSDDGTVLVLPAGGGYAEVALASGAATPVDFAPPAGASIGGIHWDAAGLHALFEVNDHELWESTILGSQTRIFVAPETIEASSITWSTDGSRAAFWTIGTSGSDTAYRLYVVSIAGHSGGVVALGRTVGGPLTWSPDGTRLAYLFGDRLFTTSVVAAGAANPALGRP